MISIDRLIFFRLETTKPPELDDGKTMEDPDKGSSLNSTQSIDEPCLKTSKGDEPPMKSHELIWNPFTYIYIYIWCFPTFPMKSQKILISPWPTAPGPNEDAVTTTASRGDARGGGGKRRKGEMWQIYTIPFVYSTWIFDLHTVRMYN